MPGKINHKRMKSSNRSAILESLRLERLSSRQELTAQTGLSVGAISMLVDELISEGWIREDRARYKVRTSNGSGRHRVPLSLNPEAAYIIGCEADSDRVEGILIDISEQERNRVQVVAEEMYNASQVMDQLQEVIAYLVGLAPSPEKVRSIGVSVPGYVDRVRGVGVQCSRVPGWQEIPVRAILEERFPLSVEIDNTARMRALAEKRYGLGQNVQDMMYIHVGAGIGAGLISKGKIFRGATGSGGEIGHTIIYQDGPLCSCGNRGCLQAIASVPALEQRARELVSGGVRTHIADLADGHTEAIHFAQIAEATREGDKVALSLVEEAAVALGLGITNAVHLLNPEFVILGGPVVALGENLLESVRRVVKTHAIWETSISLKIEFSGLSDDVVGARGAAVLGLDAFLNTEFRHAAA